MQDVVSSWERRNGRAGTCTCGSARANALSDARATGGAAIPLSRIGATAISEETGAQSSLSLCNIMVTDNTAYDAISDPTRRSILDALRDRELSAGDIAKLFPVSRPAVSRHIRVLRLAGLLTERRSAQSRLYSINAHPLAEVDRWIQDYRAFWETRLLDLKSYAESVKGRTPSIEERT